MSSKKLSVWFCIPQKNLKELIEILKIMEKIKAKQDGGGTNELNQCFHFIIKDTESNVTKMKKLKKKYKIIIRVSRNDAVNII